MPIVNIQTNLSLDSQQQKQLLTTVVDATSEALSTDKARIDASLQTLSPEQTIVGGVHQRPYVRYTLKLLAGRTPEAKQALVEKYDQAARVASADADLDVKTIIHDLQRADLALGDKIVG